MRSLQRIASIQLAVVTVHVSAVVAFVALDGVAQRVLNVTRVYNDVYPPALKEVYMIWMREDAFVIHYIQAMIVLKVSIEYFIIILYVYICSYLIVKIIKILNQYFYFQWCALWIVDHMVYVRKEFAAVMMVGQVHCVINDLVILVAMNMGSAKMVHVFALKAGMGNTVLYVS